MLAQPDLVGGRLRAALTDVADRWLSELLGDRDDVALVAVGGYGRREPAAGSDLDLLLLHPGAGDVAGLAQSLWYPVWDSGVGLDHSVRTVEEAVAVAASDLKAALGLLDARHVAGDPALTSRLREQVLQRWRREAKRQLPELVEAVQARGERYGELAFLLEPDLKEARGGIRDVTAMTAVAAAWVSDAPDERLRACYEFVLDVRGELHRRLSRAGDRLVAQEHAPVAAALGIPEPDVMLQRLYESGRAIAYATDQACRRALEAVRPARRWRRGAPERRPLADGVVEQDREVHLARDADPARDALLTLRVAAAAAQADLPIAPYTLSRLAQHAPPLSDPWPEGARDALVATLGAGPSCVAVLEGLDQAGLLVRLLPEWERVRCKPQHNPVHRFTVDRHLIEAAVGAAALTRRVSRPDLLLLGALLHDIGKGWPGDHTEAGLQVVPGIGRRMGLQPADVEMLTTLVRHHLLLPDMATRRDLNDPATIERVAVAVGDRTTLGLLHALTEADAAATGPAAWGEWKAGLVADLVRRTAAALEGEPPAQQRPLDDAQQALVLQGRLGVDLTGSRITIVAPDRPGLLWRWAAVVALHRVHIRAAVAQTVAGPDGPMAVTELDVEPRFGQLPDVEALRGDVRRAYDDGLPLAARLTERERAYTSARPPAAPPQVLWMDDASRRATVVEVRAHDLVGLLYRLTRAMADLGLDVQSATIATLGAEVVDAFYIAESDGTLVEDAARRQEIGARLLQACQPAS